MLIKCANSISSSIFVVASDSDDVFNESGTVGDVSITRSKTGRRKSMLGSNVVYLLSSESDDDNDDDEKNGAKVRAAGLFYCFLKLNYWSTCSRQVTLILIRKLLPWWLNRFKRSRVLVQQGIEIFRFHCKARPLIRALGPKKYLCICLCFRETAIQSFKTLIKNSLSKFLISCSPEDLWGRKYQLRGLDKWAPYLNSLEPLGLRCCVVYDGVGWGGLVKVCIFHNQKMHVYFISVSRQIDSDQDDDDDDSFRKTVAKPKSVRKKVRVISDESSEADKSDNDNDESISLDTIKKKYGSVRRWPKKIDSESSEEDEAPKNEYDFEDPFIADGSEESPSPDSEDEEEEKSFSGSDEESSSSCEFTTQRPWPPFESF